MDKETKQMFEMVLNKLNSMDESQKQTEHSLKQMGQSLKQVEESQKYMGIRQDEMYTIVKAIEHSNTINRAQIDNITYRVAHTEGTINKIGDVIDQSRAIK